MTFLEFADKHPDMVGFLTFVVILGIVSVLCSVARVFGKRR